MNIITIYDKKVYSKQELNKFNNLSDRLTEFINFISFICKKYKLSVSRLESCNSEERNLGIELIGNNALVQLFYEYDINTLELVVCVENNELIETNIRNDIWRYINTVEYKKGDKVINSYGEEFILQEDIIPSYTLKKYKAIKTSNNSESYVINNCIFPYLD